MKSARSTTAEISTPKLSAPNSPESASQVFPDDPNLIAELEKHENGQIPLELAAKLVPKIEFEEPKALLTCT
jgi:hypothetical protein